MKTITEIRSELARHKPVLARKYHIHSFGIFGSYAQGTATENSDIDILVQFDKPIGFDFVTLAEELESILKMKVDVVSQNALKPKMFEMIKKDLIYV